MHISTWDLYKESKITHVTFNLSTVTLAIVLATSFWVSASCIWLFWLGLKEKQISNFCQRIRFWPPPSIVTWCDPWLLTQFTWCHHQNNLGCAILVGNGTVHYSVKGRILGDFAFTRKPCAHQHGERGTVDECDARARVQCICTRLNLTGEQRLRQNLGDRQH